MLSYLLYLSSLLNADLVNQSLNAELTHEGDVVTGGLIVKMGPVTNLHVADVKMVGEAADALPSIAPKGSLDRGLTPGQVFAVRYGK
jgi:hypothetical protein